MAGISPGVVGTSRRKDSGESYFITGVLVRDSFDIVGTLKAEAGFTTYIARFKITVRNSEGYHMTQEYETLKRFSDIQALSKQLEAVHAQSKSKMKFPALVKAKYFERFKDIVIEERKKSAQELFHFITRYPHLSHSAPFQHFIAESRLLNVIPTSRSGDDMVPITAGSIKLSPSPSSECHEDIPVTLPDLSLPLTNEEEGLSVGSFQPSKPLLGMVQSDLDTKNNSGPDSDAARLGMDNLIPVLDTSGRSGGSSNTGSNVSLEILDLGETLTGSRGARQNDKSDDSSCSSSGEEVDIGDAKGSSQNGVDRQDMITGDEGRGGEMSEMSWWTDAIAETDNMVVNDLDALVDRMGKTGVASGSRISSVHQPATGKDSLSGSHHSSRQNSRQSSHQGSPMLHRRVSPSAKRDSAYVVQAGRLITQALLYESQAEYDEAFDLLKAGVDVLLNGVQTDQNKDRREVVRRKTSEYLLHAESLQKRLSSSQSTVRGTSATSSQALTSEESPVVPPPAKPHHLQDFSVKEILGKVMLVESKHTGQMYVFKVLYKSLKTLAAVPRGQSKATKNRAPLQSPYMVKLLHFYETHNHRIFLLLEHVKGKKLLDYVVAKRQQWRQLREAASNPPPSSSLLSNGERGEKFKKTDVQEKEERTGTVEMKGSCDDEVMEKMLSRLTSIVPPSSLLPDSSLTSDEETSGSDLQEGDDKSGSGSLDILTIMRKRLEESVLDDDSEPCDGHSLALKMELTGKSKERHMVKDLSVVDDEDGADATILILPPTPTAIKEALGSNIRAMGKYTHTEVTNSPERMDSLIVGGFSSSMGYDSASKSSVPSVGGKGVAGASTDHGLIFSPSSAHTSPDLKRVDDWNQRLEQNVRRWAAQIVLALEHLHFQDVICGDLHPDNILLTDGGDAVLTYFGKWDFVDDSQDIDLANRFCVAPELLTLSMPSVAMDWWCLGVFLFELLTGQHISSCLPGGTHSHLPLPFPVPLSSEAQSLLSQLLQVSPTERLGSGPAGAEEIKAHPFFAGINWRRP